LLWYFIWQAQNEINIGLLMELWNSNLVNLFVSPLKFWEFIVALMSSGFLKSILTFAFASFVAGLIYQVDPLRLGLWLLPFALILMITGWCYAFLISGVILRFGTSVQSLGWTLIFILSPFSAVYYPVSILPEWAQTISRFLPTSYVFESMRSIISTQTFEIGNLFYAGILSVFYFTIAAIWLRSSFNRTLEKGLVKVK
jgi:ABC-2 type transport system permease protein